ncbi:MAG TPA: ABC transporter permease [Thermoanaerobaculia bacterium]|nr:ABC transporter permease [Thermoanaerobaculia bacterium]
MSKALVIARREIAEKKFVFLTAVAAAILPFLATLLPLARNWSRQGMVAMTGSILATGLALGLAVVGGASMIGRELAERRLSFYFARPVGAASIWFGKLAASVFIVLAAPAIVLVPALLFAGDQWRTFGGGQWSALGALALGSVLLLCISHMVSTFVRSRSMLVVIDFVLAVAAGFAIPMMIRPLWNGMAVNTVTWIAAGLAAAFVLAVIIGGAWQVADGRTDRKRSHAALSRAFWLVMGIALLCSAAYVAWVVSPKPSDILRQLDVQSAKEGNWIFLSGQAPHRSDFVAGFAYDMSSGRYVRVNGPSLVFHSGTFSRDGKTALIREQLPNTRPTQTSVLLIPLEGDGKPIDTGLTADWRAPIVLSDDGRRIAYRDVTGILTVYDVPSKRSLVSVRFAGWPQMFFVSPDVLRLYSVGDSAAHEQRLKIEELDVRTKAILQTGELRTQGDGVLFSVSPDGSKLLLRSFAKGGNGTEPAIVADARTGQRITTVVQEEGSRVSGAALLADGTLFVPVVRNGQVTARFLGDGGTVLREVPLGRGERAYVAAELTGNRLIVSIAPATPAEGAPKTYLLDAAGGRIIRTLDSLGLFGDDPGSDPRRGAPQAQPLLAAMTRTEVLSWNPLTGEKKHIAGRYQDKESRKDLLDRLMR